MEISVGASTPVALMLMAPACYYLSSHDNRKCSPIFIDVAGFLSEGGGGIQKDTLGCCNFFSGGKVGGESDFQRRGLGCHLCNLAPVLSEP